jgi:hypothetical protein
MPSDENVGLLDRPLDIFNDQYFGPKDSTSYPTSFPFFQALPTELRLKIWTWHLHRHRFIRIQLEKNTDLEPDDMSESSADYGNNVEDDWNHMFPVHPEGITDTDDIEHGTNGLHDAPAADSPLRITFLDAPNSPVPALPLVCRESYEVYTSFYRIRLPAHLRVPSRGITKSIVAYIHPDLDILSLQASNSRHITKSNILPFFLHTLLRYDSSPVDVRFGVRNLCIDLAHNLSADQDPKPLPTNVLESVRVTVSHLRNLYFRFTTSHLEARLMSGPLVVPGSLSWYNASLPILPASQWNFPRMVDCVEGCDPRLVQPEGEADLRQVWTGNKIRTSLDIWARQEQVWGVCSGAEMADCFRVRALVGLAGQALASRAQGYPNGLDLMDRNFREDMRREQAAWLSLMSPTTGTGSLMRGFFERAQQQYLPDSKGNAVVSPEDWILQRQPQTAIGFWLIDPEPLEAAKTIGYVGTRIVDLSSKGKEAIELWAFEGPS